MPACRQTGLKMVEEIMAFWFRYEAIEDGRMIRPLIEENIKVIIRARTARIASERIDVISKKWQGNRYLASTFYYPLYGPFDTKKNALEFRPKQRGSRKLEHRIG